MLKDKQQKERKNPMQPTEFKKVFKERCPDYLVCEFFMTGACDGCPSHCITNTASER